MPTAAAGGGRYITHGGELVGAPPILSRTHTAPSGRVDLDPWHYNAYTARVAAVIMKHRLSSCRLFAVLVGGLLAGGCISSFAWPGSAGARIAGGGREEAPDPFTFSNGSSSILRKKPVGSGGKNEIHVVGLLFDVVRVDLPVDPSLGLMRHSRKIWNHVDELRVDSERVARLARNGLRVGAAPADAWPAIRAILHAADAEVRRDRLVARSGLPLTIELASISEGESIFSYAHDGRLVGKTFPVGDKLLNLDYVFHPELGGCTELRLSFEVRHDRGMMTWQRLDGVIRHVPAYDRHVFTEAGVPLTLNTDEFLVIGLSDQAQNEYLLGSRFLTFERSGSTYETLLCITPKPYQTRAAGSSLRG